MCQSDIDRAHVATNMGHTRTHMSLDAVYISFLKCSDAIFMQWYIKRRLQSVNFEMRNRSK